MATRFHPHDLVLKKSLEPYTCNGCNEIGYGPRYQCLECNFYLHTECNVFPETSPISHEFFPNFTFKFFISPPKISLRDGRIICDACIQPVRGFVYHCENQNLDLHPCCINLDKNCKIQNVEFNLHKKVEEKCLWCKKKSNNGHNGWSYMSECGKYHVHVACLIQIVKKEPHESGEDCINDINKDQTRVRILDKMVKYLKAVQARGREDAMAKHFLFF